tara:strand:+ start:1256 stop:2143 length:888 start_codon:yes stop_codon:yes gene_type:complete
MSLSKFFLIAVSLGFSGYAEEERITYDGSNKRDPIFIAQGKTLVYCLDEKDDLIRAVSLDLSDPESEPVALFDDDRSHQTEIAYSPDERFVTFSECVGNLTGKLVIRDLGAKKDAIIKHSGRGAYRTPVFTVDGKRVIYAFAEKGPMQLWSVDLEGKDKKQITESEGLSHWPSFTPDGEQIVFANSRENNYEIYIREIEGGEELRLTENRIMDIRPRVSPDGSKICFVSTRDGNYEIYVMNIDGSNVVRITDNEERDDFPSWHPDGNRIVYVSERDGQKDIFLVDIPKPVKVTAR